MTPEEIIKRFPHKSTGKNRVSELQVLESAAGYYIGTLMWIDEGDPWGPYEDRGSRESCYFATKEEAEAALHQGFIYRDAPENQYAQETGMIPKRHLTPFEES